jgi:tRNA(Met) C34 N-acetyltransferase TmcA
MDRLMSKTDEIVRKVKDMIKEKEASGEFSSVMVRLMEGFYIQFVRSANKEFNKSLSAEEIETILQSFEGIFHNMIVQIALQTTAPVSVIRTMIGNLEDSTSNYILSLEEERRNSTIQ